jgi:hypothetical protein
VREIVVVWTSPIGETVGGAHPPWNHASWQQLNGPNGKTAFGAVICVEFVGPYGFHFWSTCRCTTVRPTASGWTTATWTAGSASPPPVQQGTRRTGPRLHRG